MKNKLQIKDLGKKDYADVLQKQKELVAKRKKGIIPNTLILTEHPHVITIGKNSGENNLLAEKEDLEEKGIKIYKTERGGDITYHGPGQIVGYPILNLKQHKKDLHWLMRIYEEIFINILSERFDISANRISGLTGVWVNDKKITSIGIGAKHWISYHGFAFNYDPNLEYFKYIIPCGIKNMGVTSLKKLQPNLTIDMNEIKNYIIKQMAEALNLEVEKHE